MQVIKTSFESTIHNLCADLVHQEISGLQRFTVGSVVCAPVYALTARVVAVAAHAFWIGSEAVMFMPRMIGITVGLAVSEKAAFSRPFFQRAAHIYGLYFHTIASQFALGSMMCVVPEFSHYVLELHKPLFALQLETFIQSLPDLPHVQKDVRRSYAAIDSIVQLYLRLGLTDIDWRESLSFAIKSAYRTDPNLGPKYLTTDTREFQEAFKSTLLSCAAYKLNQKQNQHKLNASIVEGLHLDIWRHMKDYLEPGTQVALVDLIREVTPDYQVNNYFIYLSKLYTRHPDSLSVLHLLLEKMKESRLKLIQDSKFTQDDIESYVAQSPMTLDAIVRLIDGAKLTDGESPAITFHTEGRDITFSKDHEFFDGKPLLVELKKEYSVLTAQQKQELYELCCSTDNAAHSGPAWEFFKTLQSAKENFFDKKMSNNEVDVYSQVNWLDAFSFET